VRCATWCPCGVRPGACMRRLGLRSWATLSQYFQAQEASGREFPVLPPLNDFVPYDNYNFWMYWSGYFTSR
jgi:hypothetical protein